MSNAMASQGMEDAATRASLRVRECKAQLYHALQRRHRNAWRMYWTAFQQYLVTRLSLEELHTIAEKLLGQESIRLHNEFVVALLQDIPSVPTKHASGALDPDPELYSSEPERIKSENVSNGAQGRATESLADVESAALLMGLGKVVFPFWLSSSVFCERKKGECEKATEDVDRRAAAMRMSSARAAEASRTAPPRLQRQASVLHEIQETQEKENLETRYTRLMSELAAVCEDRNQVLTPESLEYLASVGRPEPIKLEREPEKVAEITEKGGKHDDLLSADAARRQRVEELTRFFMEAKSDIEFALGGREFREGRDKDRDGESEREEERGNETGDDDDDAVKGDETGDPATDAAILHHRLLKDKIDERVYNVMLSQLREQDAALYGAILCHPLVTGVDAKKDRRTKKKRKDRERKDKSQASSPVSSMLSPDFSSPALSDDEMKQNISRFVARAIADKSLQGLLLASKLILSWLLQPAHVDNGALELPVASHLRVLRGEKAPEFPKPSVTVTSAREVNLSASTIQDDRLSEANIVSESGATMDVDELHVVSEVGLPSTMDVDNEGEASITARDQLTRFGEVGVDRDSGDEEDGADIDGAESADDEGVDEDALMARAIALSLSPEMNQAGGAVIGTKVRFVETWRQGGTCLVEGRLRADGNSFSGCYEDAKSHTSGNIVGHKVKGNGEGELSYLGNDGLLVLEVICANLIGYFSRSLIDCSKPDLIIDTFSTLPASEEEIVADGPSSVDADGTAKLATECSGDEYEGWVNSLLLSGGLPSAVVTAHLGDVVARLATLSQNSMTIPQLSQASDEWFQFVSPKAAKIGDRDSPVLNGSSNDFLQDLINTRGSAVIIDRWVSRHVGESPFLRLGGEPMKVAKRTVCAAMIWHSGFLTSVKKIAEATPVELIDSEQRPHENLMHIWRAAQRVIEWGIRAKNSMGSSYAVIAALVIRKAQFLLGIEPSSKAVAASVAVSALGHDGHANTASTKSAVYECAERIYSEVLMQVSRFLEAPIRISSLQSRMLAHSTKAFLRVIGMMSFRYFAGDASGGRGALSSTVHSSFALSTLIQWLSSSAVEHPGVITVVKETTDGSETNLSGSTTDSNHYLSGLGGCGKYLKNDLHDAFEALYSYLSASLSKATWAHDVDLQLVILEAWGIIIQPDDHAFLSRVGVFRVLQTVLDEARSADTTNDVMNPEERTRSQDSRRRVVQATLKVVHLLAAQVAQAGEVADSLIISPTETTSSGQLGMSAIPLLRKPSGPETLGKSVFHMLYTELKNALEELREGNSVSNKSEQLSEQPTEPTEAEPNNGGQAASALDDDVEEYCYQICSLLYSVSGSPVCRSHLSSSRWLRLLLLLLQVDAVQIQRRTLKLLRRLLPELDPTTVKLSPSSVDGFDADSDDDDEIEDADDHAASLIRFFMKIIGTICPPSLAEVMLRKLTGDGGIGNQDSGNTEVGTYTNSLAGEVVLLLRSLYKSPKWATHLALAVVSSLSSLPTKCVTEGLHHGAPADSDVEMEDTSRDMPSIEAWKSQNASYLDALSALCIIDGHTEGLHVGGTVKILPKSSSSSQEISLRGARGIVISYEPEKAAAEVLIRGSRGSDSAQQVTSSSSSSRPIRIPVDDLLPVPEVELDTSAFADEVLSAVLVEKFTFFVDEIKKSLDDLKATDLLKADDGNGGIDDDDDMSNDGSSTPSAMDSEMAISGGAESDVDSDPGSPHPASNVENQSESADVHSEMEKESKLHRMLLCQHGMRATALLLRDERAATAFIRNGGSHSLRELLKIATSETPTAGLGEIGSLEESWMFLWARWFSMRQASAYPTPDVSSKSSSGAESAADDAPNASVQQMMEMGFPKEWCEVALARCSQNVEAAINFCFEHSNDMERLVTQHKGSRESAKEGSGSRSRKPDAEAVNPLLEQLAEMGFPLNWCKKALVANRNNVDAALTWILSNGEALEAEDRRDEEAKQRSATDSGVPEPVASPAIVKPNPLRAVSGQASIGETDMMVEGLVGGGFASVGAPDCLVSSGRWYYEATLHTNGCIQIGWADIAFCGAADRGDGVGDGAHSWAYDGWRQQKWHGQSSSWGSKWKQGDVIGCSIDVDAGTIIFSLNGKMKSANMGVAFRGIKFAHGVYPCASFNRRERLQFNLGGSQFKYQAPPGFRPIIEVLCSGSESVSDLPTGFGVLGRREDCLEEAIGEENYVSDARYFGRDLHASMTRSSGSHSRSANLIGSSRADMLAELKAIPDDRLYLELLVLTRSLAILHARRALLTLLAKWPGANVGDFSIEVFLPAQTSADAAAACETTTAQFIDFVKLVGGLSNSAMGVSQSRSAEVDELLDHGACGRQGLSLILDVARSALDRSLVASPSISPVHQASFVRVFVARISNEVKLASQRQYARVPWDSGDVSVTASLVQISSESGQAWSDSEVVKHPNLFLVEWMSRLLMDSLSRYHGQLEADNHHQLRTELLKAWLAALKSPGMCVKEKAFVIISGILQDMLLMSSSKGDIESSDMKNLIERVLEALSLPRLVDLAEERLLKEYSQLPICSRYVQSVVELVAAGSLATNLIGQSTDALFFRDVTKSLAASTQLENDMFAIDAKEYEDAQERKRQLAEEAEIRAKEAAIAKQEEQSAAEETADEQMQDDGAAPTQPESNNDINDTNMDVDSDNEDTSDITLSAIANMVAEDSDVVAAAAAIAAASKGHLIIKDPSETSNPEGKPVPGDFEYTFPDEKIVFDTSMLDSREIEMLEAGSRGILGDESLQWHYGSELGIMSDTKTSIWSGQVTQFKLPTGNSEVNIPELSVGCKVIRGPNWKWRDQDGGEGSIGTVEGVSPWSGVEGEGMSVRWPNDSLYTYRWGADGNYDLIHVEVSEEGLITKHYPTPKTKSDDEGTFGCELHLGVLIHLFEDSRVWKDGARKVNGVMEWPDFGAAVLISGVQYPDSTLCIQEIQMTRGNPDMGWFLRFGTEAWQPGTKYILRPVMSESNSELVGSTLQGEYSHMARRNGSLVEMRGEVRVSTKHLFTMDPYNHFSTLAISDGGMTVTCNSGETRNLSLGTVGFATGVHYWEVRVDQAEFGSVFIGVCEKAGPPGSQAALSSRLNRWHGWGFVNFRATYHNSTERIYGDHFNAGDTIGVRLDMEQGKLSFFMDGMKFGEHIVADLGVAFDNLKGERNSRTLYPCIGMRKSGDRVALNGKWVSLPGVSPRQLLRDAIDVSSSLHSWYLSLHAPKPTPVKISESLLREAWREWKRWSENRWQRYPVRPRGVLVDFDTYPSSCIEVSKQAGLAAPFLTGDRVRICAKYGRELNQPEEAVVLGVYRGYLWYRTETQGNEGADEGRSWAWYFTPDELSELLLVKRNGKDMTLIENSATDLTESMASEVAFTPQSDAEAQAHSSFEAFANLATSSHTPFTDMQFVDRLNTFCAAIGVDVTNLKIGDVTVPIEEIEKSPTPLKRSRTHSFIPDGYFSAPLLKAITGPELRARCALLRVLNGKISRALPMIALQPTEPTIDVIEVAKSANLLGGQKSAEYPSSSLKLRSLRRLVFTSTKRAFWDAVLRSTTTNTPLPSDEYEDPREIRVIRINRIQAQPSKLSLLAQPSDRLRRSVFGQLYREMRTWNDSSFRRAYCGKGHGGQRRAFKVKFLGEGVNDYGGPYRAVFEQVVDELQMDNVELSKGEQGLLPLLIPCPNRRSGTGSNQDKFLLNPSCGTSLQSSGPMALDLHRFLGKIIGTGVRHGLQMGLDLPSLVWRPLAGLDVNRAHLESVDVVAANNLTRAEECSQENAHDILDYLNFTITLSDGSEVPLCQSGDALQVSLENRALYIRLAETTRLTESAQQLAALRDGLAAVLPMELAPLFTPRELEVLICGRREVDVDLLQQCTEYGEGIDESMPHVEAFWEVLKEMSSDERTSFLRFVWARSRMPNSAKDFPMNFKIQTAHDSGAQVDPDKYLPHAQTCFFALRLPNYTSKDILRDKLLYAIQNSPNMDADVRLHNAEGWADA
ncbi:hypothetical protein Poli38472_010220 [Pythium oligandrum]|uniref:HECT-type E3 ubiquitin transferase n=1 Tax=Pythium oligandrum TaxID=41045 RepID=A0A8K1C933_PYTOL|nr:hypothetical protein Poli38472_010220 [Pythium oligandrum]|eukprot:TMW58661.1 hypothetical protein Poli38472_010220 [Pythium oligandrum]